MANFLATFGRDEEALIYDKQALEMKQELFHGQPHPDLAISLLNMGAHLSKLGRYEEALEYCSKALEMKKLFFPENHSEVVKVKNNIQLLKMKLENKPTKASKAKKADPIKMKEKSNCLVQ